MSQSFATANKEPESMHPTPTTKSNRDKSGSQEAQQYLTKETGKILDDVENEVRSFIFLYSFQFS
jgi:hypothetical protein